MRRRMKKMSQMVMMMRMLVKVAIRKRRREIARRRREEQITNLLELERFPLLLDLNLVKQIHQQSQSLNYSKTASSQKEKFKSIQLMNELPKIVLQVRKRKQSMPLIAIFTMM
jgi:hypothetical protein